MPQQIIQQPDGRWCVFSTVVDAIVVYDATEDELVEWFVERDAEFTRQNVWGRIEEAKTKSRPGESMIPTYEKALAMHEARHGPLSATDEGAE